jgi:hypothetical protein
MRRCSAPKAVPDEAAGVISLVRKLTVQDFPQTGAQVADDGTLTPRGMPKLSSQRGGP